MMNLVRTPMADTEQDTPPPIDDSGERFVPLDSDEPTLELIVRGKTGDRAAIGPWTDVYGLGATLFEGLAGCPPFEDTNLYVILECVMNTPAPSLVRCARSALSAK